LSYEVRVAGDSIPWEKRHGMHENTYRKYSILLRGSAKRPVLDDHRQRRAI